MSDASALARRLAKTHNVDLSTLSGSGADGAVTARDVLEHLNHEAEPSADDKIGRNSRISTQKAELETAAEPSSQETAVEEPQPAKTDSETPRWMFWRR